MKVCNECGESKDESLFYRTKAGYLRPNCKRCHSLGCYEDTKIRRKYKVKQQAKKREKKQVETKVCIGCDLEKPINQYYKMGKVLSVEGKPIRHPRCKACAAIQNKESRLKLAETKEPVPYVSRKFWDAPEVLPEESDPLFLKFEEYYQDAIALGISQRSAGLIAMQMLDVPTGTLNGTSGSN